jgi:serine/alanine adding enzyme
VPRPRGIKPTDSIEVVLEEVEPARWDGLLRSLGVTDVYYSRGYVEASALLAGGTAAFLHDDDGGVFPCVVRPDPVDVVSPYGYGGPLGPVPAYEAWCRERGVVSSFVVFHPLFANDAPGFRRSALAGTVAWRLEGDLLAGMHRHHRRVVRRASEAFEVAIEVAPASLDGFVELYEETMRRTGASPFYLFPGAYWEALHAGVRLVRVDVREGGELLASVLGMGEPPWLHYHLGGSRRPGAIHLALYRLACWGRDQGYEVLHLGGGVGGREDSLLEFKQRFAPAGRVGVSVGKAVHDLAGYLELSGADAVDWDGFFPAYRAPR